MAYQASWNSISYNGGGFRITGDAPRYTVRWGDGAQDVARPDEDNDGDGTLDTASAFHFYGSDGTYDVAVFAYQSGLPPIRFKAFLYSSATNDIVINGSGLSDMMTAGSGNDTLNGANGDDFLAGADGQDRLNGGNGGDILLGGAGDDVILGGTGSDLLGGDVGDDRLDGGADADYIYGDAGRDTLTGGDGDDYLNGGNGIDRLTGGAGADLFDFAPPRDIDNNPLPRDPDRDLILDYAQGVDHISVDQWSAERFSYVGSGAFSGEGPEVRSVINGGDTIVFGDADGDRIVDFSIRLIGAFTLTGDDFRI